jgi:hypothetical protein
MSKKEVNSMGKIKNLFNRSLDDLPAGRQGPGRDLKYGLVARPYGRSGGEAKPFVRDNY